MGKEEIKCKGCQEWFYPKRRGQEFHTDECRWEFHKRKRRSERRILKNEGGLK